MKEGDVTVTVLGGVGPTGELKKSVELFRFSLEDKGAFTFLSH